MKQYLYVMLSRTDTGMGRFIRFFTKEEYNHVSLCLDSNLRHFVSFARYHRDVPLAGGFVAEPPARLRSCGNAMPVKIFKIEISPSEAEHLEMLFEMAGQTSLVYNSLGALLSSCHIRCPIPGAYTCLDFADTVLGEQYFTIAALGAGLEQWEIYRGDLFDILEADETQDGIYFQKRGFWKGSWDTAVHFKTLLWRILRLERPDDPISRYKSAKQNIPQGSI